MARVQSGCYYYPVDYTASNSGLLGGWTFLLLNTYLMCLILGGPLDTEKPHRHKYWEMIHGVLKLS